MCTTISSPRLQGVSHKQLEYNSKVCDETGCYLKTKPIGVDLCMAWICQDVAIVHCLNNVIVAISELLLKTSWWSTRLSQQGMCSSVPHLDYATLLIEIPFKNSRADLKMSKFTHSQGGSRHLVHNQAASSNAYVIDRRWYIVLSVLVSILINRVHTCLLSCPKSKHLTPQVITGCYIITLLSAFIQTIELDIVPPFFIMNSCQCTYLATSYSKARHNNNWLNGLVKFN